MQVLKETGLISNEVLIAGYYGYGNTGDEVILAAILDDLRQRIPGSLFTVMSGAPPETAARFGVRSVLWTDSVGTLDAVERAGLVIIGGGGLFHDYWGVAPDGALTGRSWGIILYSGLALYASALKKPLMLWGVGAGPLVSGHGRACVKAIADAAGIITVRDRASQSTFESLGVPRDRIELTADPVFGAAPPAGGTEARRIAAQSRTEGRPLVGLALRFWGIAADPAYWEKQVAEALDALAAKTGATFLLVPFQSAASERENDVAVANRIQAIMRLGHRATSLQEALPPLETWELLGCCDLVIGMRLHSVIFAATKMVPVVSLSYDPKVACAMAELGLAQYDLPVGALSASALTRLVESALVARNEIGAAMQSACLNLRERAGRNASAAISLLPKDGYAAAPEPSALEWVLATTLKGQARANSELESKATQLEQAVSQANSNLVDERHRLASVEAELSRSSEAAANSRDEIRRREREVGNLQRQLGGMSQEIAGLRADLVVASEQRAASEDKARTFSQEIAGLRADLAVASEQHAALEDRVRTFSQEIAGLRADLAVASEQRAAWEDTLCRMRRTIQEKQEQLDAAALQTRNASIEIAALQAMLADQADKFAALRKQNEDLARTSDVQMRVSQDQTEALRTEIASAWARVVELQGWTTRQERHIETLADWSKRQASHIEILLARGAELDAEANRAWASYDAMANRLARKGVIALALRAIQSVLDLVQRITPEKLRVAVRPVYLPVYRRVFPAGRTPARPAPPSPPSPAGAVGPTAAAAGARVCSPGFHLQSPVPLERVYPAYLPRISVVLPVWNHASLLPQAVRSVLAQSHVNLELIVVDDGSDEDLLPALQSVIGNDPRVRVIRRWHEGLPQTLSAGFRFAEGDFVTWTSADNLMHPEMLQVLLGFLLRRPDADMTYADMDLIDENGAPLAHSSYRVSAQRPGATHQLRLPRTVQTLSLVNDNFIGACFLYRAEIGRALGDYDSSRLGTEDYDYWLRLSALGRIEHADTDECLYSYRVHDDSLSGRHSPAIAGHALRLIEFHRRRVAFFRRQFQVAVLLTQGGERMALVAGTLADLFRERGHQVVAIGSPEASEVPAGACEAWLGQCEPDAKLILVCFGSLPAWIETLPSESRRRMAVFLWVSRAVLKPEQPPPALAADWALCAGAELVPHLPASLARQWSLLQPSRFSYQDELLLLLKARDNTCAMWDLPEFRSPLIVYAGPIQDGLIDWKTLRALAGRCGEATILFVATDTEVAGDPRRLMDSHPAVVYLGYKPLTEVYTYLSRADLLIAPFLPAPAVENAVYDVMVSYLAAGKPVLATSAVAAAGFQDAPNTLFADGDAFAAALPRALEIKPDFKVTDLYLERKSPRSAVDRILSVANDRIFLRTTEGGVPSLPHRRSSMPKCLLETESLHRGGLERVVMDLAVGLQRRNYPVCIAVTGPMGKISDRCASLGIEVFPVERDPDAFDRVLAKEQPGILIPHYSNLGAPLAWKRGIPVLSFIHNSYMWIDSAHDRRIREADLFVTRYVAVSRTAKAYFTRKYNVDSSKIVCIPNGIDAAELQNAPAGGVDRAAFGLGTDHFVVLCVASIIGTKAQVHAIAALNGVRKQCPGMRLLLVGPTSDEHYYAVIKGLIQEWNLADRVILCGETDSIGDYYRMADAFLLSSVTEGWSLAKTEAMLFGLPLVLTDVGGAAEVITNGDLGILVPPAYDDPLAVNPSNLWPLCTTRTPPNLLALQAALLEMYSQRAAWKAKGKRGTEKVLANFDYRTVADRHCREIDDVVARHRGFAEYGVPAQAT